jgi:hydroxymethylpyrimidine/phosphomethylpyrimidine kinase
MPPVALTIAGSDPSGGAGIQADLKTFHQFGVYGEAAITLLTIQNTRGVTRVELVPPEIIREQVEAAVSDISPQAAKTGALGGVEQVELLAVMAASFPFPLVVDPVMVSKHGARLLLSDAEQVLRTRLLPHCALVTPNIAEAEALSGITIDSAEDAEQAARRIAELGCHAVLIKGGHLEGPPVDLLYTDGAFHRFEGHRVQTANTHGTGCTCSAAITALLARGEPLLNAVQMAKRYIQRAIETAPGLGSGSGPVNHFAEMDGSTSVSDASS